MMAERSSELHPLYVELGENEQRRRHKLKQNDAKDMDLARSKYKSEPVLNPLRRRQVGRYDEFYMNASEDVMLRARIGCKMRTARKARGRSWPATTPRELG